MSLTMCVVDRAAGTPMVQAMRRFIDVSAVSGNVLPLLLIAPSKGRAEPQQSVDYAHDSICIEPPCCVYWEDGRAAAI
jgi:hypothetical protein